MELPVSQAHKAFPFSDVKEARRYFRQKSSGGSLRLSAFFWDWTLLRLVWRMWSFRVDEVPPEKWETRCLPSAKHA